MQTKNYIRRPLVHILVLFLSFVLFFNGTSAVHVSDLECMNIYFEFDGLSLREESESITVSIDGAPMSFLQSNQYIVPTKVQTVYFPSGTHINNIHCEPRVIHTQSIIKDLPVTPSFQCLDTPTSYNSDLDIQEPYSIQRWFDYSVGHGIVENKGVVIVTIQVYPIQYHPLDSRIDWAEEIDVHIDHTLPSTIEQSTSVYDYIILTPQEYSMTLDNLASHKNERGISTKVITLDEIYMGSYFPIEGRDQQEQIKYFIKNAYDEWGISYVLLVGGSDHLPVRKSHLVIVDEGSTHTCEMASDLYYADIYNEDLVFSTWDTNKNNVFGEYNWNGFTDDIDLHPDVHIGRIPCNTEDELRSVIEKIIEYEDTNAYTKDWFTRFVVVGGDSAPDDDEDIDEGEYATENAIDIMQGFTPTRIWASNGDLYSKGPLNKALNDGAGFSYFSGHGHRTIWSTHPHNNHNVWLPPGSYSSSDVGVLDNDERLPIVILDACYVGQFDAAANCFSWSFLNNRDGGCIGIFSSTYTSFFYPTSYVTEDLIGKMAQDTLKAYRIDGAITLGEMWTNALNRYISANMDGADYFTVEEWLLMGDPTLMIAKESTPPEKPSITGPSSGKTGEELVYTTSTTDIDGDKVYYLFDWGDGSYSEWFGPYESGELCTDGRKIWQSKGEYSIRVQAKDEHGKISEWSDPLPVSMPQPKTLFNQRIMNWFNHIAQLFEGLKITDNSVIDDCGCCDDEVGFPYNVVSQRSLIDENLLMSINEHEDTYPFTSAVAASDLPSYFNWKDMDGKDYTTPAKHQANCGSCWDFAGIGAIEAVINIKENDSTLDPDLSEQYVLSCLPDAANNYAQGCNGGQPVNAFHCIMSESDDGNYCNGVIWETCFDYRASHEIDCSEKCEDWLEYLVPISNYGSFWNQDVLENTEQSRNIIKNALIQHGPVGSFMDVPDSFIRWGERHHSPTEYCPYEDRTFNNQLNHAILIVGWKDDPAISQGGYWICKNSWGMDWGYDGFYNIEYGNHFTGFRIDWVDYDPASYNWEPYQEKPYKPTIQGPSNGKLDTEHIFTAMSTDPSNEQLYYLFDWDDESNSEWLGPFDSGETCETTHIWLEKGGYNVRVKAKNTKGVMSEFSDPLPVKMPKNHYLFSMMYPDVLFHFLTFEEQ